MGGLSGLLGSIEWMLAQGCFAKSVHCRLHASHYAVLEPEPGQRGCCTVWDERVFSIILRGLPGDGFSQVAMWPILHTR